MFRKSILIIGIIVILAMGLYPPWNETLTRPSIPLHRNESGWLFDPPYPSDYYPYGAWEVRIDLRKLGLEWLLVCIAVGGILWISKPDAK